MVSEQPYTASSSLVWQRLITTWVDLGRSARANEQPCSAQMLISALIWSRTGDIPCLGMAADLLCVRLQSQMSSEKPGAQQGQGSHFQWLWSLPRDFAPSAACTHPMIWLHGSTKGIFNERRARSR